MSLEYLPKCRAPVVTGSSGILGLAEMTDVALFSELDPVILEFTFHKQPSVPVIVAALGPITAVCYCIEVLKPKRYRFSSWRTTSSPRRRGLERLKRNI